MKFNKLLLSLLVATSITAGDSYITSQQAKASTGYQYTNSATNSVEATKAMPLFRVTIGSNESKNKFHFVDYVYKGTHLKVSDWIMSTGGGYVVKYGNYQPSKKYFYFVMDQNKKTWFKKYNANQEAKQAETKYQKFVKSHPTQKGNYQFTDDKAQLKAIGYDTYQGDIQENASPFDSNALLPTGYVLKSGQDWQDTKNNKVYRYVKASKENEFKKSGWFFLEKMI